MPPTKKLGKPKNPAHNRHMDAPNATERLTRYSRAEISATELRRALGGITYADIIIDLAARDLPLPRAAQAGREAQIATARAWLFPPAE